MILILIGYFHGQVIGYTRIDEEVNLTLALGEQLRLGKHFVENLKK